MKQTIYIDVLVAVNLFVNYFLLLTSAKFLKISAGRLRLVAAAALGAVYSLVILLPPLAPWFSLLAKLVMSGTIVLAAFPIGTVKLFLRSAACFYLTSFAFAGLMLGVWYVAAPKGMVLKNSVIYFDISPMLLLILTVLCYGLVSLLNRLAGQQQPRETFCRVTVCKGKECACFTAKIDTGNSLTEPFSGYPVVIAEYSAVEAVVPSCMKSHLFAPAGSGGAGIRGFRFIPFTVVGGGGVLPAFQPDSIVLQTIGTKVTVKDVYLAVYSGKLAPSQFRGLVNPQLLSQGEQINRKGKES